MEHPLQQIAPDEHGRPRFRENKIVSHLLEVARENGCDLNTLACMEFPAEDRRQLAQLIGYSVDGYGSLSYVPHDLATAADHIAANPSIDPRDVRAQVAEDALADFKKSIKGPIADLFGIHPESLEGD